MSVLEGIQIAHMLADLNDLNASQQQKAAKALVSVNKSIETIEKKAPAVKPTSSAAAASAGPATALTAANAPAAAAGSREQQHPTSLPQRTAERETGADHRRTASPAARFDLLGRRLMTPPMSRTNSASSSMPGTPRHEAQHDSDDVDRAFTLMALYEIREKLKQQDNQSLQKAREKVQLLMARQHLHSQFQLAAQQAEQAQSSHGAPAQPSGARRTATPADGRPYPYSYPKGST